MALQDEEDRGTKDVVGQTLSQDEEVRRTRKEIGQMLIQSNFEYQDVFADRSDKNECEPLDHPIDHKDSASFDGQVVTEYSCSILGDFLAY